MNTVDKMAEALRGVLFHAHSVPVGDAFDSALHVAHDALKEYDRETARRVALAVRSVEGAACACDKPED